MTDDKDIRDESSKAEQKHPASTRRVAQREFSVSLHETWPA